MTDEPREREVRVNSTDLRLLKSATAELDVDVPLGYVARLGAKKILEESDGPEVEF